MSHFRPRKLRPMRPEHYRRITLRAREYLARIEQGCAPRTPHELRALTLSIKMLHRTVRELAQRHEAQDPDLFQPLPEPHDAS
jgi:hypothetical protein